MRLEGVCFTPMSELLLMKRFPCLWRGEHGKRRGAATREYRNGKRGTLASSDRVAQELNRYGAQSWSVRDQASLTEVLEDYFFSPCDNEGTF